MHWLLRHPSTRARGSIWILSLLGLVLTSLTVQAQSFIDPSGLLPATSNVGPFLNGGDSYQDKQGTLIIGDENSGHKLCLNPMSAGTTDATNCIANWGDLKSQLNVDYVQVAADPINAGPGEHNRGLNLSDYTAQTDAQNHPRVGFVNLQPLNDTVAGVHQDYALIVNAPGPLCLQGVCINDENFTCSTTADCQPGITYGLYATDGGSANSYAMTVAGAIDVEGKLCLSRNGQQCITKWGDVGTVNVKYLALQSTNNPVPTNPGGIALTGVGSFGTGQVGSNGNIPTDYSCGDGICEAAEINSCVIDCETVGPPIVQNTVINPTSVQLTLQTTTTGPSGNRYVLVVRSKGQPPSFQPQTGSLYAVGSVIGNATIVYATTTPIAGGSPLTVNDTGLLAGSTYYYDLYQANLFPRYSTRTSATEITAYLPSTFFRLTVSINNTTYGSVTSGDGKIFLGNGGPNTTSALYPSGAVVSLKALAQYQFDSWIGGPCDGSGNTVCSVTMNSDIVTQAQVDTLQQIQ